MVQSRNTGAPLSLSSENLRVSPPSKRIRATERPTTGRSRVLPSSSFRKSLILMLKRNWAPKPNARSRRMEGSLNRQADHWASIPRPKMMVR